MAIIKFSENDSIDVKLSYDKGKMVSGKYGVQYLWSCNEDDVFYATESLNSLLEGLKVNRGQTVSITKVLNAGESIPVFQVDGKTLNSISNLSSPPSSAPPSSTPPASPSSLENIEQMLRLICKSLNIDYDTTPKQPAMDEDIPF
jgi:hypothetical protein